MVEESEGAGVIEAKDSTVGNEEVIEVDTELSAIEDSVAEEEEVVDDATSVTLSAAADVVTSGSLSIPNVSSVAWTVYCVVEGSEISVVVPIVAPDASTICTTETV